MADINCLPDELLIEILKYFDVQTLNRYAEVSHRWRRVIEGTTRMSQRFVVEDLDDMELLKTWPHREHIKYLSIHQHTTYVSSLIQLIGACCPNLTHLTIEKCVVLDEVHFPLVKEHLPKLVYLDLFLSNNFISKPYWSVLHNMKGIVLNNQIDDDTLLHISKANPELEELHMFGYVQFYPIHHLQLLLTTHSTLLRKLSLRSHEINNHTCHLISKCSNLTHLRFYHGWLITDDALLFLRPLNKLKVLHLTGLGLISVSTFTTFFEGLNTEHLEELNCSSCAFGDEHVPILLQKGTKLETLELWNTPHLSDSGLLNLVCASKLLYIVDTNRSMPDEMVQRIIDETNVRYLTFNRQEPEINIPEGREFEIRKQPRCRDEFYFRGNSEGYRANLMCFAHQYMEPPVDDNESNEEFVCNQELESSD